MFSRSTWYQPQNSFIITQWKNPTKQHTTMTCHNKMVFSTGGRCSVGATHPKFCAKSQACWTDAGHNSRTWPQVSRESSPVGSTWESKLDKTTQLPVGQGMLSVCHRRSHKEGRWQFGLLTKNQDNWALLEGITQSACFHCLLWAEFEFLSMSVISQELLPPRCSPCFMEKKEKPQQSEILP